MTIMLIALLKNKGFILFGFVFFAFFGIKRIINDLINGN